MSCAVDPAVSDLGALPPLVGLKHVLGAVEGEKESNGNPERRAVGDATKDWDVEIFYFGFFIGHFYI